MRRFRDAEYLKRNRGFESDFLQQRVCEPSVSLWTTTAFGPIFRLCSKLGNQLQLPQLAVCGDSACQESVPDDICCAGDPKAPHRLGRRWNLENVG